jgi:acyl-coenzyme A thioesterase PaaI-like protein
LDVGAYLALLPLLTDEEEAITHALTISYLSRAERGARLVAKGAVIKRTRRVAFVEAQLRGETGVVAKATVVKSIVSATS